MKRNIFTPTIIESMSEERLPTASIEVREILAWCCSQKYRLPNRGEFPGASIEK